MINEAVLTQPMTNEPVIAQTVAVAQETARAMISMQEIWKTYQMGSEQVHALHGVSFEVKKGEYLAII